MAVDLLSRMRGRARSLTRWTAAVNAAKTSLPRHPLTLPRPPPYCVARLIYQSLALSHDRRELGMVVQLDGALPAVAVSDRVLDRSLADTDPEVFAAISAELHRQQSTLEMIASENFAPVAVMQAQGSVLTNKYAEGYPGRRYYGGCEHVDVTEQLAIDRVKDLFGAHFANVQPHSGAQANTAVFFALLSPGDTVLGLSLAHGGHLTHGMKLNYSGKMFEVVPYQVRPDDGLVDMDEVERLARAHRPRMIIAGWSAYPRQLDFARFRAIADEVGAYLMVDMAHFAGLVAAGLHPSPVPYAHVTTTTTHKTLGGPRGGVILTNDPA